MRRATSGTIRPTNPNIPDTLTAHAANKEANTSKDNRHLSNMYFKVRAVSSPKTEQCKPSDRYHRSNNAYSRIRPDHHHIVPAAPYKTTCHPAHRSLNTIRIKHGQNRIKPAEESGYSHTG